LVDIIKVPRRREIISDIPSIITSKAVTLEQHPQPLINPAARPTLLITHLLSMALPNMAHHSPPTHRIRLILNHMMPMALHMAQQHIPNSLPMEPPHNPHTPPPMGVSSIRTHMEVALPLNLSISNTPDLQAMVNLERLPTEHLRAQVIYPSHSMDISKVCIMLSIPVDFMATQEGRRKYRWEAIHHNMDNSKALHKELMARHRKGDMVVSLKVEDGNLMNSLS